MKALPLESPTLVAPTRLRTQGTPTLLEHWHLLSLDAPTVATAWMLLAAQASHVRLAPVLPVAMFVAVWMLYALDRLLDARLLDGRKAAGERFAPRHYFHRHHAARFRLALFAAAILLAGLIAHFPSREHRRVWHAWFAAGCVVCGSAFPCAGTSAGSRESVGNRGFFRGRCVSSMRAGRWFCVVSGFGRLVCGACVGQSSADYGVGREQANPTSAGNLVDIADRYGFAAHVAARRSSEVGACVLQSRPCVRRAAAAASHARTSDGDDVACGRRRRPADSVAGASIPALTPNFDRVARGYRWAEYLALGPLLERTRTRHLDALPGAGQALVLGRWRWTLHGGLAGALPCPRRRSHRRQPGDAEPAREALQALRVAAAHSASRRARLPAREGFRPRRHALLSGLPDPGRNRRADRADRWRARTGSALACIRLSHPRGRSALACSEFTFVLSISRFVCSRDCASRASRTTLRPCSKPACGPSRSAARWAAC